MYGLSNWWNVPVVVLLGRLGVVLFFVLSGFLITYLLLAEERSKGSINIPYFYLRRVLRIWPLYFAVVLSSLLLLPSLDALLWPGFTKNSIQESLGFKLLLYLTFFANLVNLVGLVPYATQAWSVGTEEQFYLFWPVALRFFRNRFLLILLILVSHPLISYVLKWHVTGASPFLVFFRAFWEGFSIDHMCVGAIFALLLFQRHKWLPFLVSRWVFSIACLTVLAMLILGKTFPIIRFKGYSLCFGLIILNLAANQMLSRVLEQKPIKFLGKISYGLYMLHPLCIGAVMVVCLATGIQSRWFLYPTAIALTVVLSYCSYRFFESPFLSMKEAFSPLSSKPVSVADVPPETAAEGTFAARSLNSRA